jgi:hypothetical protein
VLNARIEIRGCSPRKNFAVSVPFASVIEA